VIRHLACSTVCSICKVDHAASYSDVSTSTLINANNQQLLYTAAYNGKHARDRIIFTLTSILPCRNAVLGTCSCAHAAVRHSVERVVQQDGCIHIMCMPISCRTHWLLATPAEYHMLITLGRAWQRMTASVLLICEHYNAHTNACTSFEVSSVAQATQCSCDDELICALSRR
jgi:hypothetical protein